MSEMVDEPPENGEIPAPPNAIDEMETELPPTSLGTPEEIQAMLEEPTGTHLVDDGADGAVVVETQPVTQPGVETAWQEPRAIKDEENRVVLQPATGTQTVGEQR